MISALMGEGDGLRSGRGLRVGVAAGTSEISELRVWEASAGACNSKVGSVGGTPVGIGAGSDVA